MRSILVALLVLPAAAIAETPPAETRPDEAGYAMRREACVAWMLDGAYPSGLEEVACTAAFGLPSPFLLKCANARQAGYATEGQREACALFLTRAADATRKGYVRR